MQQAKRFLTILLALALLLGLTPGGTRTAKAATVTDVANWAALEAAAGAGGSGDIVRLTADIVVSSFTIGNDIIDARGYFLLIGRDLTLDLNGNTLEFGNMLINANIIKINPGITLNIVDSGGGGNLKISFFGSIKFSTSHGAAINTTDATLNIYGGTINVEGGNNLGGDGSGAGIGGGLGADGGTVNIYGGTINARGGTGKSGVGTGGTGTGGAGIGGGTGGNGGTVNIYGGNVNAKGYDETGSGSDSAGGGAGIGGGGSFSGTSGSGDSGGSGGSISIYGGNVVATGGPGVGSNGGGGAGVGGGGSSNISGGGGDGSGSGTIRIFVPIQAAGGMGGSGAGGGAGIGGGGGIANSLVDAIEIASGVDISNITGGIGANGNRNGANIGSGGGADQAGQPIYGLISAHTGINLAGFMVGSEQGTISAGSDTVTLALPVGTNLSALMPTFWFNPADSAGATLIASTGSPAVQVSGVTTQDFSSGPVVYSCSPLSGASGACTVTIYTVAPSITGPTSMTLSEGYAATQSGVLTAAGTPAPTVRVTSPNAGITWNNTSKTLNIAAGIPAGIYPVTLTAEMGSAPTTPLTFTLTVVTPGTQTPPTITGPSTHSLAENYAATSVPGFSVGGSPTPSISITADQKITWNAATNALDIAAGLTPGTYPVALTASNGVSPDATLTFTLKVNAPQNNNNNSNNNSGSWNPPAPIISNVTFTHNPDGSVTLHINASGTGLRFQWQVRGSWLNIPGATSATYHYTGLTMGKEYTVRCKVMNSYGITTYSKELTFTAGQAGTVAASAAFPVQGEITAKDVNVRQSASAKGTRLHRLQMGDNVTLLGYKNGFFQIEWEGGVAYVSADYVNAKLAAPIEGTATRKLTAYSRMSAKAKYKAGMLKKGETLSITGRYGKWWRLTLNGQDVYAQAKYVKAR